MENRTRATPMLAVLFSGAAFVNGVYCQDPRGESRPATEAESRPVTLARVRIGPEAEWFGGPEYAKIMEASLDSTIKMLAPVRGEALAKVRAKIRELEFPITAEARLRGELSLIEFDVRAPERDDGIVRSLLDLVGVKVMTRENPLPSERDVREWTFSPQYSRDVRVWAVRKSRQVQFLIRFGMLGLVEELSAADVLSEPPPPAPVESILTGHGLEVVFRFDEVVRLVKKDAPIVASLVTTVFGSRTTGFAGGLYTSEKRAEATMLFDIHPGDGLIGKLLQADMQSELFAGWIPSTAGPFAYGKILTTNLPSIAKQLRVLQAPIDPVHWGENWSWFADALGTNDLSEIVARYWTGDFAYMTTMRTVKDVFDPNASRPYVALLGNPKPQDAIDWLQRMCQEYDDLGMRLVSKPVSPGVFEFSMGAKLVARLAPGQGFLAVAGGDEASRLLLRDVLETRGQAKPPAILAKRLGPEKSKRPRCLTFVTHVVNQLDFQLQISRAAGQPDDPRLVEYLEGISEAVKGDLGFGAGYATVTPDGILIRSSY